MVRRPTGKTAASTYYDYTFQRGTKRGHRTEPPIGKYYTMLRPTADVYFGQIWLCRHIRLQNISLNVHT